MFWCVAMRTLQIARIRQRYRDLSWRGRPIFHRNRNFIDKEVGSGHTIEYVNPIRASSCLHDYRKRAKEIDKRLKERPSAADRAKLLKKQKALSDMADNKDWLAGKPGSQLK